MNNDIPDVENNPMYEDILAARAANRPTMLPPIVQLPKATREAYDDEVDDSHIETALTHVSCRLRKPIGCYDPKSILFGL